MSHTKPFFLSVTQRIFSNWTALKLAVEHDMGPVESAVEFCSYITETIYMNDGLTNDQIVEELEYYMADQFNTELLDNSPVCVAAELLRFYQYCLQGNELTAKAEFDKLPPLQSWLIPQSTISQSQLQPHHVSPVIQVNSNFVATDMQVDKDDEEFDEDCGPTDWHVVHRRRRRR